MKTSVQLYGTDDPKATQIPVELINLREFTISTIAGYMRIFGIGRLTAKPGFVGIKSIMDVTFKPLTSEVPESLVKSRNYMVRHMAELAVLFGILDIEIQPTEDEFRVIRETWVKLSSGVQNITTSQPKQSVSAINEIKLNIDHDPTGAAVTEDNERAVEAGTANA